MLLEDEDTVPLIDTFTPWPHQAFGYDRLLDNLARGTKRTLLTMPTGGGKTWVMWKTAQAAMKEDWGVTVLANRKMLIEQMQRTLSEFGMDHGVRSAGVIGDSNALLQVASIQTEYSRVVKKRVWSRSDSRLVLLDEAHLHGLKNKQSQRVIDEYLSHGALLVGFTATPLGLDGCYDDLVIAGTNSQLRECGALVPSVHYGCTEPDLQNIGRMPLDDIPEEENIKAIMVPQIHARVVEWYRRLNPHGLPSIGFAPGVKESVGFAEHFEAAGIPAAHIDGERVWIRGQEYPSTKEVRRELLELSRTGKVRIVWNRFVLREAIDMPWLRHGILATVFGNIQPYLQAGGRLLRACPSVGKTNVIVQDHGGNWWRHGSLNSDRVWRLTDTARSVAAQREFNVAGDTETPPTEPQPFLCPSCGSVVILREALRGIRCHCANCGHQFDFSRRSRPVLQTNGVLVEHEGDPLRPRTVERRPNTAKLWESYYWRAKNGGMTFSQAVGLFFVDNGYFPPRTLPLMPKEKIDYYLPVKSVAYQNLIPKEKK